MEFDVAGAGSVLVGLTAAELRENGLTFETLDYGNAATRALVARLLRKAAEETGALLLPEAPLRIDVLPRTDGGCLFLFSRQTQDLSAPKDCAFFSDDIFAMIDAARACRTQVCARRSALSERSRADFAAAALYGVAAAGPQRVSSSAGVRPARAGTAGRDGAVPDRKERLKSTLRRRRVTRRSWLSGPRRRRWRTRRPARWRRPSRRSRRF